MGRRNQHDQGIQGDFGRDSLDVIWESGRRRRQATEAQAKRNRAGVEESIDKGGFYWLRENHDRIPTHKSCVIECFTVYSRLLCEQEINLCYWQKSEGCHRR